MTTRDLKESSPSPLADRFRTYLPVVIDIETGGFNSVTDAVLEISAVILSMNKD
jgi:ribonuclease T